MEPEVIRTVVAHGQDVKWFYVRLAIWFPMVGFATAFVFHRFLDWMAGIKFRGLVVCAQEDGPSYERAALWHYLCVRWAGSCAVIAASLIMLGLILSS